MPYRCNNCEKLSAVEDIPDCPTRASCDLRRVAVIHLETPEGKGRLIGSAQIHGVDEKGQQTASVSTEVRLGCDSVYPNPASSTYYPAVTCLKCIANHPLKEVSKDE